MYILFAQAEVWIAAIEPMGDGLPFPKRLQAPAVNIQDCGV